MNKLLRLTGIMTALALLSFSHHRNSEAQVFRHREVINNAIHGEVILCSGEIIELGKCLGKANCTACTTCEYCKHCNSGGSCGVCAGGSRYEPEPPKLWPELLDGLRLSVASKFRFGHINKNSRSPHPGNGSS